MDRYNFPDIECPAGCQPAAFQEGYHHALSGQNLHQPTHYRKSFRMGFRAGILLIRKWRREHTNVRMFPTRQRFRAARS
jgi:hypothetical protein